MIAPTRTRLSKEKLEGYRALPLDERVALPGQTKHHIVIELTGLSPSYVQVYPWEDPFVAAEVYLARQRKRGR